MTHKISYREVYQYSSSDKGITIPVNLSLSGQSVNIPDVKLDTGASHCIFDRIFGIALGLDIERGLEQVFLTATGTFVAYGHTVTILVMGFSFEAMVYFAKDEFYNRNVLGRHGWINKIRLGLIDYDSKLYASLYDDPEE